MRLKSEADVLVILFLKHDADVLVRLFLVKAGISNFELVFVSRIPQIRLKKSVTEIL